MVAASAESSFLSPSSTCFVSESDTGGLPTALTSSSSVCVAAFASSTRALMLSLVTPPLGRFDPSDLNDATYVFAAEHRPFAHCCRDWDVVVVVELLLDPPHETTRTTTT